jgi:NAD-dependent dihydropyrimidine dehydrogenase PreA subunit
MHAHYGYEDGSGRFYIVVDTDRCNACAECVAVCPAKLLTLQEEEPCEARMVAAINDRQRNDLKTACSACKPARGFSHAALPCIRACAAGALQHSW